MNKSYVAISIAVILAVIIPLLMVFSGEGGLARMTTISGIYAVDKPEGYPVVCFVDKSAGAMSCVPMSFMKGE